MNGNNDKSWSFHDQFVLGPKLTFHFYLIHGLISELAHFLSWLTSSGSPHFSIFLVKEHLTKEKDQFLNLDGTFLASEAGQTSFFIANMFRFYCVANCWGLPLLPVLQWKLLPFANDKSFGRGPHACKTEQDSVIVVWWKWSLGGKSWRTDWLWHASLSRVLGPGSSVLGNGPVPQERHCGAPLVLSPGFLKEKPEHPYLVLSHAISESRCLPQTSSR